MSSQGAVVGVLAATGLALLGAVLCRPRSGCAAQQFRQSSRRRAQVGPASVLVPGLALAVVLVVTARTVHLGSTTTLLGAAVAVLAGATAACGWVAAVGVRRERRMLAQLPAVAGLLSTAISAGEPVADALARVAARCAGELAGEFRIALATGRPEDALAETAERIGQPVVARFLRRLVVVLRRGAPPAYVVAAAAEARDQALRSLAARRAAGRAWFVGLANLAAATACAGVLGLLPT